MPTFFATPAAWRRWLATHHASADELWVGFYKRGSGRPSITWPESVDEALCYGWIDGIRKSLDAHSYVIRFTPRRAGSIWSFINLRKIEALTKAGKMRAAGRKAHDGRRADRSAIYSFEQTRSSVKLAPAQLKRLKANAAAWRFFSSQPQWYRRTATWWVVSAKQEATRERRLATLIADAANGQRVGPMRRAKG